MAMAKAHYTPTNPLVLEALEQQTEAVAGTLNAQDVSNMLCQHEYFLVFAPLWKEVDGRIP